MQKLKEQFFNTTRTYYKFRNGWLFYPGWFHPEFVLTRNDGDDKESNICISIGWGKLYIKFRSDYKLTSEHDYESPRYGFY